MARRIVYQTPTNPLAQVLYLVLGTILLIGAVVMGAVILAVVFGFALVVGLVIWARLWWLRRKFAKAAGYRRGSGSGPQTPPGDGGVEITEVEYRVVRENRSEDD